MEKRAFDIDVVVERIREAVISYPKAALFELFEEGYRTPFEILVACIISIRTLDETTLVCARRLFEVARTPKEMKELSFDTVDARISRSTFHEAKARQILNIAAQVVQDFDGRLPCDEQVLLSFQGVGPKCANLVLGITCEQDRISVDIHVHRVTNRWGYIHENTPEKSMEALYKILPQRYHVEINRILVPFGKHICTGRNPRCSACPVLDMCRQVGVTEHR